VAYTFELRPLRNPEVLAQLAEALDERAHRLAHPRKAKHKGELSPKERLRRKTRRYRLYLAALCVMGLPLLTLGLTNPARERGALLGGAALVICCGAWLWLSRPRKSSRAVSSGQLMQQAGKAERAGARVVFAEDGMSIRPARGGQELIPYDDLLFAFELNDLLVLTGLRRAVALQTLELSWGDWEEFRAFLTQRIDEYVDLRKRK